MEASKKKSFGLALLFNAIIFPGAGQIYLGRKKRGAFWALLSLLLLGILIYVWFQKMIMTTLDLQAALQNTALLEQTLNVFQHTWAMAKPLLMKLFFALLTVWFLAMADLWRIKPKAS